MILGHTLLGSGSETVIVLHEWLGDATNYAPLHAYLDTQRFRYCFADLRGYGRSQHLAGEFTLAEAVADVLELADLLGAERFHLIGHSMSGLIVQRLALDAPKRVLSLIAITPVFAGGFPASADSLRQLLTVASDDAAAREAIAARTSGRYGREWLDFKLAGSRQRSSLAARLGYLTMFTGSDFADEAQGNPLRMLVLFAAYDIPAYQYELAQPRFAACYPNAQFVKIEAAGHYPMLETPVFLAARINAFLSGR